MTDHRCIFLLLMLAGPPASHADTAAAGQTNGERYNLDHKHVSEWCRVTSQECGVLNRQTKADYSPDEET